MTSVSFNDRCEQLKSFKQENGHIDVPFHPLSLRPLAEWTSEQWEVFPKLKDKKDKAKLESLGFFHESWKQKKERHWNDKFRMLQAFKAQHGHFDLPCSEDKLYDWVTAQRRLYRIKTLREDRRIKFEEIGYDWDREPMSKGTAAGDEQVWEEKFQMLKAFKDQHGHFDVPWGNKAIYSWTSAQRALYKSKKLRPNRIEKLNEIGFTWERETLANAPNDQGWEEKFQMLKAFKAKHGHFDVPISDKVLYRWAGEQRNRYRQKDIRKDRLNKLRKIGFDWVKKTNRANDHGWEEKLQMLKEFKAQHGHFDVPTSNASLYHWTSRHRELYKDQVLRTDRMLKLRAIGFGGGKKRAASIDSNADEQKQKCARTDEKDSQGSTALSSSSSITTEEDITAETSALLLALRRG